MEKLTTTSTLNLLPTTDSEAKNFATIFLAQLEQGEINPLEWAKKLKEIKKAIELIEKGTAGLTGLTEVAVREASKDTGNEFFEIKKVTRYDYSNCCHADWDRLEFNRKEIEGKQKEIETYLRTIKGSITTVDEATGEVVKHFEPIKKASEYLSFKK